MNEPQISCAQACYSSKIRRFFEYCIIDNLVISLPLFFAFSFLVKRYPFLGTNYPLPSELQDAYTQMGRSFTYAEIYLNLVSLVLIFLYFFLMEWLTKGKSVGKYACKTVVVDKDGNVPTAWQFFIRSLCRLIPFDNISFLFGAWSHGSLFGSWHDKLSGTYVVDEALLEEWKAGNYDGSDKFTAMFSHLMRENGVEIKVERPDDQEQKEEGERKLRVEDLYPSDEPEEE